MIEQAVDAFDTSVGLQDIDVIFIENVGNLVCPVDFDLGENLSVMILSVPEGDDKRSSTGISSMLEPAAQQGRCGGCLRLRSCRIQSRSR